VQQSTDATQLSLVLPHLGRPDKAQYRAGRGGRAGGDPVLVPSRVAAPDSPAAARHFERGCVRVERLVGELELELLHRDPRPIFPPARRYSTTQSSAVTERLPVAVSAQSATDTSAVCVPCCMSTFSTSKEHASPMGASNTTAK